MSTYVSTQFAPIRRPRHIGLALSIAIIAFAITALFITTAVLVVQGSLVA